MAVTFVNRRRWRHSFTTDERTRSKRKRNSIIFVHNHKVDKKTPWPDKGYTRVHCIVVCFVYCFFAIIMCFLRSVAFYIRPCTAVDPLLGKVDYTLLSQQVLMDLAVAGIQHAERMCGGSEEVFIHTEFFSHVHVESPNQTNQIFEVAEEVPQNWQTSLMDRFYAAISETEKNNLSKGNSSHHHCEWKGVTCAASVVTGVMYNNYRLCGNFNVHSLPPTVERIDIRSSGQRYDLQTRAFPRQLENCRLDHNHLFGSVDLRTLPANLYCMNLSDNKLTGPIDLCNLPYGLEYLYLENNNIKQSVVYYDHLPAKVKDIQLIDKTEMTNQIGKVCAVHRDMAVENKAIFTDMPEKKIR